MTPSLGHNGMRVAMKTNCGTRVRLIPRPDARQSAPSIDTEKSLSSHNFELNLLFSRSLAIRFAIVSTLYPIKLLILHSCTIHLHQIELSPFHPGHQSSPKGNRLAKRGPSSSSTPLPFLLASRSLAAGGPISQPTTQGAEVKLHEQVYLIRLITSFLSFYRIFLI
ncbi:hypothetical protein PGT21_034982 [Puccinia graminis f. sp. tritici]|uniref:Uncharacterized protein n=1 Tax=Puccinia graminis f. sp. tritici TaxID=56615 RepID=A0A5B0PZU9_PUCGR|nr:hypothetical protein PGT21_034982 [Puccinia graminis f. sp. tritici]